MRDQWYGDNRDIVKSGVLAHLARTFGAARILHIVYYRPTEWNGCRPGQWPELEIDGAACPIPAPVLRHFRDLRRIRDLDGTPPIELLVAPFQDRGEYLGLIVGAIKRRVAECCSLVFLDPDTGLAPRHPDLRHVLDDELAAIWHELPPRDSLVFYQHQTNRAGRPWMEEKLAQFERALGVGPGAAKVARGPKIALDVAFFYCVKGAA